MEPLDSVTETKPIQGLVDKLNREFEAGGDGTKVRAIMEEYAKNNDDWKQYCHFCPLKYSRNLVARTPKYELMVICWGKGQVSPVHNHEVCTPPPTTPLSFSI